MARDSVSFEARPQRPSTGLGVTMMRWAMIEGKCGLLALPRCLAEATTPAKTGRAPVVDASAITSSCAG